MKKFFSTFLIGALVITSMSMLNSCKDYDDDIDDLQDQVTQLNSLKTDVENLKTTVASAQSAAQSALDKANANANDISELKTLTSGYANDIAEAVKAAADAKASAEESAALAQAAKDSADKALSNATKAYDLATQNVAKLQAAVELADSLSKKLDVLAGQVSDVNANFEALKKTVESYTGSIKEIYSAVTSIELFGSYSGGAGDDYEGSCKNVYEPLILMHGLVPFNSQFGDDETYDESDPIIEFKEGDDIATEGNVLVRVNPANADITSASIKLVNSKGNVLDFVTAGTPVRFDGLITRGETIGTSLWKIPFKVAAGKNITEKMFNEATVSNSNSILFAVAINNTPSDTTRFALTTFDVALKYENYEPASTPLEYTVEGIKVADIHNRWEDEEGGRTSTEDAAKYDKDIKEYKWAASSEEYPTPSDAMDEKHNVTPDVADYRYGYAPLSVEVGKEFVVKLDGENLDKIKNYYVALDQKCAIESKPSEWNAWYGYEYEGLFTTVSSSDPIKLKINSEEANGDIIGFRVFAVNYDGTLVDPDGRAFYVQVGDPAVTETVFANDTITSPKVGFDNTNVDNTNVYGDEYLLSTEPVANMVEIPLSAKFVSNTQKLHGTLKLNDATKDNYTADAVYYVILDADKQQATNWKDAKYIRLIVNLGGKWKDDTDLSGTIFTNDESMSRRVDNKLNVTIHKVLPTSSNTKLRFRPTQGNQATGEFTLYMVPDAGWAATSSVTGSIDLDNTFYNLPKNIIFTFDDADVDDAGNLIDKVTENGKVVYGSMSNSNDHVLSELKEQFIDNETYHDVFAAINYGRISSESSEDYKITLSQDLSAKFACWHTANTYQWAKGKKPSITWTNTGTYPATNISADVEVKNTYDSRRFSGKLDNLIGTKKYFTVKGSQLTWVDPTGQKQINPYLTPSYENGEITWARTQEENSVTATHDENLEITVVDCYGHESVITLAVTIKKAE